MKESMLIDGCFIVFTIYYFRLLSNFSSTLLLFALLLGCIASSVVWFLMLVLLLFCCCFCRSVLLLLCLLFYLDILLYVLFFVCCFALCCWYIEFGGVLVGFLFFLVEPRNTLRAPHHPSTRGAKAARTQCHKKYIWESALVSSAWVEANRERCTV